MRSPSSQRKKKKKGKKREKREKPIGETSDGPGAIPVGIEVERAKSRMERDGDGERPGERERKKRTYRNGASKSKRKSNKKTFISVLEDHALDVTGESVAEQAMHHEAQLLKGEFLYYRADRVFGFTSSLSPVLPPLLLLLFLKGGSTWFTMGILRISSPHVALITMGPLAVRGGMFRMAL